MQKLRAIFGGSSPIAVTALLSVVILLGVATHRAIVALRPPAPEATSSVAQVASASKAITPSWQQEMLLLGKTTATDVQVSGTTSTSTDHLAMIGPMIAGEILGTYSAIHDNNQGTYSQDDLKSAGARIAVYMKAAVSYEAFENSDFKTVEDTSSENARTYRDSLLAALTPIASIQSAEYEIYARYVQTGDKKYLTELKDAAIAYRAAALSASKINVPSDAINYHRDVLNSLRAFASVIDGLADHADDPFASVALLRAYNEKEQGIHDSYDRMRAYYAKKAL